MCCPRGFMALMRPLSRIGPCRLAGCPTVNPYSSAAPGRCQIQHSRGFRFHSVIFSNVQTHTHTPTHTIIPTPDILFSMHSWAGCHQCLSTVPPSPTESCLAEVVSTLLNAGSKPGCVVCSCYPTVQTASTTKHSYRSSRIPCFELMMLSHVLC